MATKTAPSVGTFSIGFNRNFAFFECGECHVTFGIPQSFEQERRRDHAWFCCPNGHEWRFGMESDEEKVKRQLREARAEAGRLAARSAQEREERKAAERRASAAKGQVTKIKRRVGKGVCPCCNRTFENLSKHMESQHPDYGEPS